MRTPPQLSTHLPPKSYSSLKFYLFFLVRFSRASLSLHQSSKVTLLGYRKCLRSKLFWNNFTVGSRHDFFFPLKVQLLMPKLHVSTRALQTVCHKQGCLIREHVKTGIHNWAINTAATEGGVSEQTEWRPGTCQLKTEPKQRSTSIHSCGACFGHSRPHLCSWD